MNSIALDEMIELTQQTPLPKNIIKLLDDLSKETLADEELDVAQLYEGVILAVTDTSED